MTDRREDELVRLGVAQLWLGARQMVQRKWEGMVANAAIRISMPADERLDDEADQIVGRWLRTIDRLKVKGLWYKSGNGHDSTASGQG